MERKQASDYPQGLLDLFHEWQHGDMDRRTFMDHLSRFATTGLTAAALFESLTPNHAWANRSNEVARMAFILLDGKFD